MHQSALGEVKTATDASNLHERIGLGSRETRDEVLATRFLMMALLTVDIVDPIREGRRAMYSPEVNAFNTFSICITCGGTTTHAPNTPITGMTSSPRSRVGAVFQVRRCCRSW